jgi:hypothetical protein
MKVFKLKDYVCQAVHNKQKLRFLSHFLYKRWVVPSCKLHFPRLADQCFCSRSKCKNDSSPLVPLN